MEHHKNNSKCRKCLRGCVLLVQVIFWVLCLIAYLLQFMFGVWSAVLNYRNEQYVVFALISSTLLFPILVLSVVSLVWYRDQDRLNKSLQQAHPDDRELQQYHKLFRVPSIFSHVIGFGHIYRYGQLIILTMMNTTVYDVISLKRDALLLQFLHGFLSSAPLITVQLYVVLVALTTDPPGDFNESPYPITMGCLISASVSLILTVLCYIASDRLHCEKRRIVLPAHFASFFWHAFLVPARIVALSLFALAYGPYITIIIGIHWIASIIWTFFEKTNFCGDLTTTPPKKRLHLEIPFVIVVSFVYTFLYFNVRDGSTMSRIIIYHILTSVETLIISALFYVAYPNLVFAPWIFAFTVSFYILGVAFMALYYAAWHPGRTNDCFCLGIPHACDCCELFHKKASHSIANVDLPLDGEGERASFAVVRVGGMIYNQRMQERQQGTAGEDSRNGSIHYNPLSNLSALTESVSKYTIAQVANQSRLSRTPPYRGHKVLIGGEREETRDNHVISRDTPTRVNNTSHHSSGHNSILHPQNRNDRQTWLQRSRSERYYRHSTANAGREDIQKDRMPIPKSTSLSRRPDWRRSVGHYLPSIRNNHRLSLTTPESFGITNHPHTLPSSIGEDQNRTGETSNTPILQINGVTRNRYEPMPYAVPTSRRLPKSHYPSSVPSSVPSSGPSSGPSSDPLVPGTSIEPCYSVPGRNVSRKSSTSYSDTNYTDFSPYYLEYQNHYINVPMIATPSRHRSLSPIRYAQSGYGSRHGSPNSRSANCTPKQSPYTKKKHRKSSNPLHTRDAMQEFTQLYNTSSPSLSPARYRRSTCSYTSHSSQYTGDETGGHNRMTSTSSSYLVSSDNHSEIETEKSKNKTSAIVPDTIPISDCSRYISPSSSNIQNEPITSLPTITSMTSTTNDGHFKLHRNGDEILSPPKLYNINGTLV